MVVKSDDDLSTMALNNNRIQYALVPAQRIKQLLVERHGKNGHLFDIFFANPDFQVMILDDLARTYDEFRQEGAG